MNANIFIFVGIHKAYTTETFPVCFVNDSALPDILEIPQASFWTHLKNATTLQFYFTQMYFKKSNNKSNAFVIMYLIAPGASQSSYTAWNGKYKHESYAFLVSNLGIKYKLTKKAYTGASKKHIKLTIISWSGTFTLQKQKQLKFADRNNLYCSIPKISWDSVQKHRPIFNSIWNTAQYQRPIEAVNIPWLIFPM